MLPNLFLKKTRGDFSSHAFETYMNTIGNSAIAGDLIGKVRSGIFKLGR